MLDVIALAILLVLSAILTFVIDIARLLRFRTGEASKFGVRLVEGEQPFS